jgi:DNA polymerase I
VGTKKDLEDSQYTEDDCVCSYVDTRKDDIKKEDSPNYEKYYYVKPEIERGFMPEVVDMLMGLKDDYSGTELYGPVKIVVNAVWGVLGDADSYGKGYRLFDWRLGESVTLFGRKMIQYSAKEYVNNLNVLKDEYGYDGQNAYQVGGDTDSVMSSIPYVDATDRSGQQKVVDIAQEACEMVNDSYDEFASETFNATGDYMELEIESYSPYLFVPEPKTASAEGKKRYAQITAWEEGEWYDKPEFSATGIDIVRSDRAEVTRDVAEDVIDTILRTDDRSKVREKVYERLNTVVTDIKNGDVENRRLARPKGMGQPPDEYGSLSNTPQPTYRGAKYANQHFEWENMDEGSKPALLYIDKVRAEYPRTYTADTREGGRKVDAVALEEPNKLPEAFVIDYGTMVEKVIEDPLNPILAAMGWSVDEALADSSQGELSQFM